MTVLNRCFFLAGLSFGCLATAANAQVSATWQEFPREVNLFKSTYKGNFLRTAVKRDIFIFQQKVVINSLLHSNGGDVLIVADELVLNAPIDTRVYLQMGENYWVDKPPGVDVWASSPLPWILQDSPKAQKAFDEYYLWRQYYDAGQKKYVYGVGSRPKGKSYLELPQLPSGQVPLSVVRGLSDTLPNKVGSDGADAPDNEIIWENVRSGSIRIYASSVKLCDDCAKAVKEGSSSPPEGDAFDEIKGLFFQVSGLKGGRGGAGSLPGCWYDHPCDPTARFCQTCGPLPSKNGGLSGRPGKGGDAGSIEFHFINSVPSAPDSNSLVEASDVRGGRPADVFRRRTRSYSYIKASTNARDGFTPEGAAIDLKELVGKDGSITSENIDTVKALIQISALLLKSEIEGNYDINLMLNSARSNPALFSISPTDVLVAFLSAELNRLQRDLIVLVNPFLDGQITHLEYSKFFDTLPCQSKDYIGLPPRALEFIYHLCAFRDVLLSGNGNSVRGFLLRTGGLFRSGPIDVNIDLRHGELIAELNRIQQVTASLLDEVSKIHLLMYGKVSDQQRDRMGSALKDLERRLAALVPPPTKSPSLFEQLGKLGEIASHFGKAYGNVMIDNWPGAAQETYAGLKSFDEWYDADGSRFVPPENRWDLELAIDQAKTAISDFNKEVIETKRQMVELQNNNLKELLASRGRIIKIRTAAQFRFEEIVRAVIVDYLQTPADRVGRLNSNLARISAFLQNEDSELGALKLQPLKDLCLGNASAPDFSQIVGVIGCALIERRSTNFAIFLKAGALKELLPLVVMSSGSDRLPISFGLLFDKESLEEVDVSIVDWR